MRATVAAPRTMNTRTVAYSTSIVSSCPALGRKLATKPPPDAFYLRRAKGNCFMPRGCELYTIDTTILRIKSKSTKKCRHLSRRPAEGKRVPGPQTSSPHHKVQARAYNVVESRHSPSRRNPGRRIGMGHQTGVGGKTGK